MKPQRGASAWLSGVGATSLVGAVTNAIGLELWFRGLLQLPRVGRPEFEVLSAPAFAVGAAVGLATGGWRGIVPVIGLASVWSLMIPLFASGLDADFYMREMWGYVGVAVGLAIGAVSRRQFGWYGLVGAAIYTVVLLPEPIVSASPHVWCEPGDGNRCFAIVSAIRVLLSIVAGAAAGAFVAPRLSLGETLVVAVILALPSGVVFAEQGTLEWEMQGIVGAAAAASGVLGGIMLVLVAIARRSVAHVGMVSWGSY